MEDSHCPGALPTPPPTSFWCDPAEHRSTSPLRPLGLRLPGCRRDWARPTPSRDPWVSPQPPRLLYPASPQKPPCHTSSTRGHQPPPQSSGSYTQRSPFRSRWTSASQQQPAGEDIFSVFMLPVPSLFGHVQVGGCCGHAVSVAPARSPLPLSVGTYGLFTQLAIPDNKSPQLK